MRREESCGHQLYYPVIFLLTLFTIQGSGLHEVKKIYLVHSSAGSCVSYLHLFISDEGLKIDGNSISMSCQLAGFQAREQVERGRGAVFLPL